MGILSFENPQRLTPKWRIPIRISKVLAKIELGQRICTVLGRRGQHFSKLDRLGFSYVYRRSLETITALLQTSPLRKQSKTREQDSETIFLQSIFNFQVIDEYTPFSN